MEALDERREVRRQRSLVGTLATLILVAGLLYFGRLFFITLFSSGILSFILEPLVGFFMRLRLPRGGASFLACTVMLVSLYLAGLGVWIQVVGFWEDLPNYSRRIAELVDSASVRLEQVEKVANELLVPQRVRDAQRAAEEAAQAARKSPTTSRRRPVV